MAHETCVKSVSKFSKIKNRLRIKLAKKIKLQNNRTYNGTGDLDLVVELNEAK